MLFHFLNVTFCKYDVILIIRLTNGITLCLSFLQYFLFVLVKFITPLSDGQSGE